MCPQDDKKLLVKRAREVYLKKWAAKRACEEMMEGVWLEPVPVMHNRRTNEIWTDTYRNVMRKLVIEG